MKKTLKITHLLKNRLQHQLLRRAVFNFKAGEDRTIPNSQMRKVIAKRLGESKFTAPHYYLNVEIDMENCIDSRNKIKAADPKAKFHTTTSWSKPVRWL